MQIIDITLPLSNQTPVWEGDRGVTIQQTAVIGEGSDFNVSRAELGVHTGTHIDAPYHLFNQGYTVDEIPLEVLIGEVEVLQIPSDFKVIDSQALKSSGFKPGTQRVIFKTSNTRYWIDDPLQFHRDFIGINSDGAEFLAEQRLKLVGMDYFSASPVNELVRPHQILLEAGIVILENAILVDVEPGAFQLICLPIKLTGTDGAPVRAILIRD